MDGASEDPGQDPVDEGGEPGRDWAETSSGAGFLPGMTAYEESPYGEEPGPYDREDPHDQLPLYQQIALYDDRPPRRRAGRIALVTLVVVVIGVIAGTFAVKASPGRHDNAGYQPSAGSPSGDAGQVTTAFLRAWSRGDVAAAAGLTDNPSAARTALASYSRGLRLRKLTGTVTGSSAMSPAGGSGSGAAAATTIEAVTFAVSATVSGAASGPGAVSGTWSYHSSLAAYQVPDGTGWFVEWDPGIVAPGLGDGQHLAAVLVPASGSGSVTDSAGTPLSSYGDPGLTKIAAMLTDSAPAAAITGGTPGLDVEIEDSSGQAVSGSEAVITRPRAGHLVTTIDPKAERAAQSAAATTRGSAIVVIAPATGHILAIANNAGGNDYALTASVAPGSTMKIITATALLNAGLTAADSPVACPKTYTVQGVTYHNDQDESEPAGTPFADDFAQSCNNAFDQWWQHLSGQLASTAKTYFGLEQPWNIGIPGQSATYFSAPASASGSELAQEAFGEGELTTSPLAMASVAATVDSGVFRQPVLVAGPAASGSTASAEPLPAGTDEQLKDMMRDVVTEGTADDIGFGPDVYAKTGTADVQGQEQPNSWLVAFDPSANVAVADLVVDAGYGAQVAGPEVKSFFDGY